MKKYTIIISLIIIILGILSIIIGFNYTKSIPIIYSYTVQRNTDYEVILNPNEFYDTDILTSNLYYASKSINNLKINFNYNFIGSNKTNLKYKYNITANITGNVNTDNNLDEQIWNKEFILLESNEENLNNSDKFSINKNINIDYQYFNEFARNYEKNYEISINAILKVKLNIFCDLDLIEKNETIEDCIELDIPLTDTVTNVNEKYQNENSKDIYLISKETSTEELICFIIGGTCIVISLIIQIANRKNFIKSKEEKYIDSINKFLKSYSNIIITVTTRPQINDLKIINVQTINDLINIAEQNQNNIIYYNSDNKKEFYIVTNIFVYIYTVKNNLEHKICRI